MKYPKLRAKRANDGAANAPEYAEKHLEVNINFDEGTDIAKELTLKIYDFYHLVMGTDTVNTNRYKKKRRINFTISSALPWIEGTYYAIIFNDDTPLWGAVFDLGGNEDEVIRETMEPTTCANAKEYIKMKEEESRVARAYAEKPYEQEAAEEYEAYEKLRQASKPSAEERLNRLIGLKRLKAEVKEASMMAKFTEKRRNLGLDDTSDNRNHMIFSGNPGTGKTTVAKLIGEIYHEMGILSSGHTIETNRTKLVGEYIGQTEQRMKEIIDNARGGVLFIDEAYTLVSHDNPQKDFGVQVVNALLPVLSEPNPDMIVILAGYEDKMQSLLDSNPGLAERFPLHFHFDDFTADELMEIARYECSRKNFTLTEAADKRLAKLIADTMNPDDKNFGNARWLCNIIDHNIIKCMAARVMAAHDLPDMKTAFSTIEECDIAEAERTMTAKRKQVQQRRPIGFTH